MNEFNEKIIISATDDGLRGDSAYIFEFFARTGVNIVEAVQNAARDFCLTEEGKKIYIGNCHSFNWGDFYAYVGNEFCIPYGFIKNSNESRQINVNFNEDLVAEDEIINYE
jgi:hypothetical protein